MNKVSWLKIQKCSDDIISDRTPGNMILCPCYLLILLTSGGDRDLAIMLVVIFNWYPSVTWYEAFKPDSFFNFVITELSILVVFQKRLPCPVILRLNRLFRLPRMWEWFDRTETATSYPNAFRICKVRQTMILIKQ